MLKTIVLGLGSNKGNRLFYIISALKELQKILKIKSSSSIYQTEPWGKKKSQARALQNTKFLNMVLIGETSLKPTVFLRKIKKIEENLGRTKTERWGDREIDIDILFYEKEILNKKELKIPHPLIHKRAFVIIPLLEIFPDFVHPKFNRKISDFLKKNFYREVRKVISKSAIEKVYSS